jgi:hypothetical protein
MHKLEALLIGGHWPDFMAVTLELLTRTGFAVDIISVNDSLKHNKSIRNHVFAQTNDILVRAAFDQARKHYSLVVVTDDPTLGAILHSDLPEEEKAKLLPVISIEHLGHIFSKIGLSLLLDKSGVNTPGYAIARDEQELKVSLAMLGYPAIVKLDSSTGGRGVFECANESDLRAIASKPHIYPVLAQKKIKGSEVSFEAFYQNGALIHFACSTVERYQYRFGPTSVRRYTQLAFLEKEIFDELGLLGKALGADGFVNISSIRSEQDGRLYFFEADMRPNLWIDHAKYFGDDWAFAIRRYFLSGEKVACPYPGDQRYPAQIMLSHYSRIGLTDLILNRYRIWKHLPDNYLSITLYTRIWVLLVSAIVRFCKIAMPTWGYTILQKIYHRINGRFVRVIYGYMEKEGAER